MNWLWDSNPSLTGAAPGFPWSRWVLDETRLPPQGTEAPYLSQLVSLQLGDEWHLNDDATRARAINWFNAIRANFPNTILYMNNFGGQVGDAQLGDFIARARPDMLSFDTYPWRSDHSHGALRREGRRQPSRAHLRKGTGPAQADQRRHRPVHHQHHVYPWTELILAAEIHQSATNSSDISFDLELVAYPESSLPGLEVAMQSGTFIASWPAWAGSWAPETTTNLAPPVLWSVATNAPVLSNGQWVLRAPIGTNGKRYYRLQTQ